jgi:2-keto-4-pentenoate hydratase/2-oxohepta-3-ene-1,7-dioic acid hydratase in catechol pathway
MKILRYQADGGAKYGVLEDDDTVLELIGSPFDDFRVGPRVAELSDVRVLSPVRPSKTIGVGLNYLSHIREMGHATPESPMLFMKPPTGVIGHGDSIVYPKIGQKVEYEAELVAVIGKPARHVAEEEALDYVLGYTCGNDVSERVIQFAEMKTGAMLVGKGFDTFCPLGPVIATGLDPTDLNVMSRLNGEPRQDANTSDLLFSVAKLVAYISEAMLLLPGDVIMTGTPSGVGPMSPGDVVEVEISGIGVLRNPVSAEA